MPETTEQLQQKIIPLIQTQQLDAALAIANQACNQDPQNADKWLLLAGIHSYRQDMPAVADCCQKAIALQPQHVNAHYNLAVAWQMQSDIIRAEKSYNTVIQLQPQHANAYAGLSRIQTQQGQHDKALNNQRKAIQLTPDNPHFHFQIAALYQDMQKIDLAKQYYEETLRLMPGHFEAMNNLGSLYHTQAQHDQAIQYFNQALQIQPQNAQIHYNLSQSYWQKNQLDTAFQHALKALQLQPNRLIFRQNFIQVLGITPHIPNEPEVIQQIEQSYLIEGINWQDLLPSSLAILRQDTSFNQLRTSAITGGYASIYKKLDNKKNIQLLGKPLLLYCLTHTVITFKEEEQLFTLLRQACLQLAITKQFQVNDLFMAFIAALACQCFNNEYAFSQSNIEIESVNTLCTEIKNIDTNEPLDKVTQTKIILLAMYQPLHSIISLQDNTFSKTQHQSAPWQLLIERQLKQPQQEQIIRQEIESLTVIEDQTSKAVQDQYEDSPYPRWLSINLHQPRSYQQIWMELFPHFQAPDFPTSPIDLLIAGCGTGSHAAISSTRFADVNVLAIDLSRQSLSYAQRMADRNQINNLRFAQADILGLKSLDQRFHIIESVGVLHHMKQPEAGLKVLRNLLHPNGMINLGFYSSMARRHITQARERFKNTTPSPENIRQARQELFALPTDDPLHSITKNNDFYSLSECRDLIFHTQERCYTIAEIKQLISSCGLRFIGFELPSPVTRKQYMAEYPEDTQLDNLDNWGVFEQQHPDTFIGMYTFWCQRVD
ncbi:MAG: tetratricopeptide repeat protein [Gammaproteobacteria bacterium]|nr:tetratricopeptide repeat protein [Gammaproteobacteria bacterium]